MWYLLAFLVDISCIWIRNYDASRFINHTILSGIKCELYFARWRLGPFWFSDSDFDLDWILFLLGLELEFVTEQNLYRRSNFYCREDFWKGEYQNL